MSEHDDSVCLGDMLSHAREALQLLGDLERQRLGRDRVLQLALTRRGLPQTNRQLPIVNRQF